MHLIVLNASSKITLEYIDGEKCQDIRPVFLKLTAKSDMDSNGKKTLPGFVIS